MKIDLKKLHEIVEVHISDPDFNVEALCKLMRMSQPTLYRKVHTLTGKNPTSFICWCRLLRAAKLLKARKISISEVAKKVGFNDDSHFSRCFKKQFHCSPSEIRPTATGTENVPPGEDTGPKIDLEFVNELNAVIEKNLSDPLFNTARLAAELYMNRSTLYRKIYAMYGETPSGLIQSQRLNRGAQLLMNHFGNVTRVAFEVGFSSSSYFCECFKKKFHRLPSDFCKSGNATVEIE
ncbi:MAG: helix-turn-helix transcriptional regulator [bacterium]|nr:helix-turn-helix transcriptional regulator [bacterium]